jgi:hypothetical protein
MQAGGPERAVSQIKGLLPQPKAQALCVGVVVRMDRLLINGLIENQD